MLQEERRQLILKWIDGEHSVSHSELVNRLRISLMTIRRDLKILEQQGLLKRVRGGAIGIKEANVPNNHIQTRKNTNADKKIKIGRYAAEHFVEENDIVILEGGSTVCSMVSFLNLPNLKIMTNGLNIMNIALEFTGISELICCGGTYFRQVGTFVGPSAESFFKGYHARKCFFGADGLTIEDGTTDFNHVEIGVKQAMLACARQRILLIDSSKLGVSSHVPAVPLKDIDIIVTDDNAPQDIIDALRSNDIDVHIAK